MKTLTKEHGRVIYQTGQAGPNQEAWFEAFAIGEDEWDKLGPDNQFLIGTENYIDLAGLTLEEKSIFFEAITVQSPLPPVIQAKVGFPNPPAGATVVIHDIITTVPLMFDESLNLAILNGIGFKQGEYDFEHVVFYRSQSWSTDIDYAGNLTTLTHQSQCGSGMPTASDRLYCYRLVNWSPQCQNALISIYPARYVLAVNAMKESDLTYIYRLKRSFELQQSFDRD